MFSIRPSRIYSHRSLTTMRKPGSSTLDTEYTYKRNALAKAELGVYANDVATPVAPALRRKYFMRSRDPGSERVRVVPELRRSVEFRRLNFMDADYGLNEKADAIFCRNVIIYFDRPTQERILQKLSNGLAPGGYMFVGHAETLHDMDLPLMPVAPALYRRIDGRD